MPKRIIKALVGGLKPWKPRRSLPSYSEPTPETSQKLTREDEAELALTRTTFTPGTQLFLIGLFLLTIASVPLIQLASEWRNRQTGAALPTFDIFQTLPSRKEVGAARGLLGFWNLVPTAGELKNAEKELETNSVVSQWLLPPVQSLLVGRLRAANEQVYLGREGWLFYRPDVDYVTGTGFLNPGRLKQRSHAAGIQPDPIKAIVQFRDQLQARGIDLVLLPIPTKASIEGERLSSRAKPGALLDNPSFAEFQRRLTASGVRVFDAAPLLMDRKAGSNNLPQFLESDTHWRPEAMQFIAERLALWIGLAPAEPSRAPQLVPGEISGRGDIARMLKLPEQQEWYGRQTVPLQQVFTGDNVWRPSRDADLLLLGDSFANIFSLGALGWGESAGFAEHLSAALGGRPLDCILRNSDGAFATREMLANELARGRDRLAGKKLVIWEFAARELAFGNWKLVEMKVGHAKEAEFFSLAAGEQEEISGTVEAVAAVPRPGTVPYKDHVVSVQLRDVTAGSNPQGEPLQALVYLPSMRDDVWLPAARLRPGDQVKLRVQAWSDVAPQYEQINRSEIDDPAVQLEEPVWGELVK